MSRFGTNNNPHEVLEDIALKHKSIRRQAGFSQTELAKRSGVSLGSIKRFELTGKIALDSLLKLASVLNRLNDFELLFQPKENLDRIEKLFSDKTRKQ